MLSFYVIQNNHLLEVSCFISLFRRIHYSLCSREEKRWKGEKTPQNITLKKILYMMVIKRKFQDSRTVRSKLFSHGKFYGGQLLSIQLCMCLVRYNLNVLQLWFRERVVTEKIQEHYQLGRVCGGGVLMLRAWSK